MIETPSAVDFTVFVLYLLIAGFFLRSLSAAMIQRNPDSNVAKALAFIY